MKTYDAIIIGSGQAGNPLARRLAGKKWKVLMIERDRPGGSCINYGCTPTKAMIASAMQAYNARRSKEFGIDAGEVTVDLPAIVARKNKIVAHSRSGTADSLDLPHLDFVAGEAAFTAPKEVSVIDKSGKRQTYTAEHIFINTGTSTAIPPLEGIDDVPYLTSTTILDIEDIPAHLVILGGSYIALEFGQMFRRFGSAVTIVAREDRFLPREDEDVAAAVRQLLEEEGIKMYTGAEAKGVSSNGAQHISLTATVNGRRKTIEGTHLLLATGRKPNTEALALDKAGVKTDEHGYIQVNNKLGTNVRGIYALGDVKGGPAFTHISYNDYLVVCKNLLDGKNVSIKGRPVPYCMFIDPELGRVGINEDEAAKQRLDYKVATLPMKHVARGIETGQTKGLMKAIVDAGTKKILGVTILGAQGGELMSLLQIAMQTGMTYEQLRENIFAHPTFSESINNLFMTLDDE